MVSFLRTLCIRVLLIAHSRQIIGNVVHVADGDTVELSVISYSQQNKDIHGNDLNIPTVKDNVTSESLRKIFLPNSHKTNNHIKIRLFGIDAPERGQPFGQNAIKYVVEQIANKVVEVNTISDNPKYEVDRYNRTLGELFVPITGRSNKASSLGGVFNNPYDETTNYKSLNKDLVSQGLAWWYSAYAPNDTELQRLQTWAQQNKRGLWSKKDPIPPWEWRQGRRDGQRIDIDGNGNDDDDDDTEETFTSSSTTTSTTATSTIGYNEGGWVIGNVNSKLWFWPSCYTANLIKPENKRMFASPAAAEAHGYKKGKSCK